MRDGDSAQPHYLDALLYERVRQDRSMLAFLEQSALDGLWFWDLRAPENEWMSPGFWALFGYAPEEKPHLASAWQDMIHPDDLKLAQANFAAHLADPQCPYDQIVRYRHKEGAWVSVRCRGKILRDAAGEPQYMLGAHTDVTELQRVRESLEAANQRLEAEVARRTEELTRKNELLEQFAYSISHDLKSSLRGIQLCAMWLEEELGDGIGENARENLAFLGVRTKRLTAFVDGVLAYSRAGRAPLRREPVSSHQIAEEVWASLPAEARARVEIRDELPIVRVDPHQLTQIFQNLLENAVRYAPTGAIVVSARDEDDAVRFSVKDEGPGIDPEDHQRIFNLFTRVATEEEDGPQSTGVGLSVCESLVERAGGRIGVVSSKGAGAEFWFTVPKQVTTP